MGLAETPGPYEASSPGDPLDRPRRGAAAGRGRPLVFGEVLFDVFEDGTKVLGGAPFNVAWHLRGLGADPALVTAVGRDRDGRTVLDRMAQWGLDRAGVQAIEGRPTGRAVISHEDGSPSFRIGPRQAWDAIAEAAALRSMPERTRLIYHGTLAIRGDRNWQTLKRLGRQAVPTLVDLNLRQPWVTAERVRWCLATSRWLKLNEAELAEVTAAPVHSRDDCVEAARRLAREQAIHQVIVTRGGEGALSVSDAGDVVQIAAPVVPHLVDTVGAGDAFSAVMCLGILREWGVRLTLERAAGFAADVCGIQGGTTDDAGLYERHARAWAASTGPHVNTGRQAGLYILSVSVHGLVRGSNIELGRDPDTGGQVSYVVDQARALAVHPDVAQVDLVTRQIVDKRVDPGYGRAFETIADGAQIVRLPAGPARYLRKESLWPHLDHFRDELTRYIRRAGVPDLIHGHYADAGYVGAQLANLLGVPFLFTGHSLGRVKRERLRAAGKDDASLERYHFRSRIEAEERALETATVVIASTRQEVEDQYQHYDHYAPERMRVIPPGVDLTRFAPADPDDRYPPVRDELARFLRDPDRPMVLTIARPDERKNFEGLIEAFASSPWLREHANLVLVSGARDDIRELPGGSRTVLTKILLLIDRHDLYGLVAYPKAPSSGDVPDLYRLAGRTRGVFINPAFTEPFGLTLLEAAASGVPVVATDDGGPRDIIGACRNGLLVDATRPTEIARGLEQALASPPRWTQWSRSGLAVVHEEFSWTSHAKRYVAEAQRVLGAELGSSATAPASRMPHVDRLLVVDIDDALTGDPAAVAALTARLAGAGDHVGFGIVTGRTLEQATETIAALDLPMPDMLITSSGTRIHYGNRLANDLSWERQIHYRWDREAVQTALEEVEGLTPAAEEHQRPYRLRYDCRPDSPVSLAGIQRHLRQRGLQATCILDHQVTLDVIPGRASPGQAIRFVGLKWDLPPERMLVAGDSGLDADMLAGQTLGVVLGNHTPELDRLRGRDHTYFARKPHAWGVLEGIDFYDFLGTIQPDREQTE